MLYLKHSATVLKLTRKITKYHNFLLAGSLTVIFLFFIYYNDPFAHKVGMKIGNFFASNDAEVVKKAINNYAGYALTQSQEIAANSQIISGIISEDAVKLLGTMEEEREKRGIGSMLVANADGLVLARLPVAYSRGDYVFTTTSWGRSVSQGLPVAVLDNGRSFPLILAGASPVKQNDTLLGAVFAGYRLDDFFATKLKSEYLDKDLHIAFYEKEEGVLGTSFDSPEVGQLIRTRFNSGTDWVQGQGSVEQNLVQVGSKTYFLKNVKIPNPIDPTEDIGGFLVFVPFNPVWGSLVRASVATLVFILMYSLLHIRRRRNAGDLFVELLVIFALFAFTIAVHYQRLGDRVIDITSSPNAIYNSTIRFRPGSDIFDRAYEQRINISLNSGGEAINTIEAVVDYDPEVVSVVDILTTNSFCSQEHFLEKSIDNDLGQVRIVCAVPTPGFLGEIGTIAELVIQPLKTGRVTLRFNKESRVLANDGLGTNVLRAATNASYVISSPTPVISTGGVPNVLVFSPSHPNDERWYNKKKTIFSWRPQPGYTYLYSLDQNPVSMPDGKLATTKDFVSIEAPGEGTYYFHIAAKSGDKIGSAAHYKVNIDTTPPELPQIRASSHNVRVGEIVRFEFSGYDALSGLQSGFYIKIDDSIRLPTLPQLYLPFLEAGRREVTLRVFDRAGNYSDSTTIINVR